MALSLNESRGKRDGKNSDQNRQNWTLDHGNSHFDHAVYARFVRTDWSGARAHIQAHTHNHQTNRTRTKGNSELKRTGKIVQWIIFIVQVINKCLATACPLSHPMCCSAKESNGESTPTVHFLFVYTRPGFACVFVCVCLRINFAVIFNIFSFWVMRLHRKWIWCERSALAAKHFGSQLRAFLI